jgi:hypothetical protein
MSRTIVLALAFGLIGSAAFAAPPERQLVAPNLNPGLKTVPYIHSSQDAGTCDKQLVDRIDSGTVVAGPTGFVAHLKGTISAVSARDAQLVVTSTSPDGKTAKADFVACRSTFVAGTPALIAASMNLPKNTAVQSITVRAQANTLVLNPSEAR